MPSTLHIDFETRSPVELKKTTAYVYFEHPHTDVWCAAYAFDDEPVQPWTSMDPLPDRIRQHVENGGEIWAHNAAFERLAWWNILTPRYGWPKPTLEQFHCTMAMASALSLPASLDGASRALNLEVNKDAEGRNLMLRMARPRIDHGKGKYTWWAIPERIERLIKYCMQDVEVERAFHKRAVALSERERRVYLLDQKINDRGVPLDTKSIHLALMISDGAKFQLDAELQFATNNEVRSTRQIADLMKYLNARGANVASLAKTALQSLLADQSLPLHLRELIEIRAEAAKASTAKLVAMQECANADGFVRGSLFYHGASTGRWAGRGIQPQNFPRPTMKQPKIEEMVSELHLGAAHITRKYGAPLSAIADCLRAMIMSPDGYDFIAADFSNIEGRVVAWLAGEDWLVEAFHKNALIYETMAAEIYNRPVESITRDSKERQLGKTAVLGCGFGMGAKRFVVACAKEGIEIDEAFATHVIRTYREKNSRIKAFWYDLERAAVRAMRSPRTKVDCGYISYARVGNFLWCRLPSGRRLAYPFPMLKMEETPFGTTREVLTYMGINAITKKWERQTAWGGLLVENVVQATARDVLVDAMFRLEDAGYPIHLTVHDEILAMVRQDFGDRHEFERIMATVPDWAAGLPVMVEGWRGRRFRK